MKDPDGTWDPPQDTGAPDAAETDPAALSSAEDLDEDRIGTDPPEHWSGATAYGTTPREERESRPLMDRLNEEQPDQVEQPPYEPGSDEVAAMTVAGEDVSADPDDVAAQRVAEQHTYEHELRIDVDSAAREANN